MPTLVQYWKALQPKKTKSHFTQLLQNVRYQHVSKGDLEIFNLIFLILFHFMSYLRNPNDTFLKNLIYTVIQFSLRVSDNHNYYELLNMRQELYAGTDIGFRKGRGRGRGVPGY